MNRRRPWLIVLLGVVWLLRMGRASVGTDAWPNRTGAADSPSKRSSSAIAITSDGATLLAVNPDSNSLSLITLGALTNVTEVPVDADPRTVAVDDVGGRAYVANRGSDSVSVVDLTSQEVITEVTVGDRPVGVALSPDGRFVAVAELGDDRVRFLNAASLSALSVVAVAARPHGLAFTPAGHHLLVAHLLSGDVTVLTVQPFTLYLSLILRSQTAQHATRSTFHVSRLSTWPHVAPGPTWPRRAGSVATPATSKGNMTGAPGCCNTAARCRQGPHQSLPATLRGCWAGSRLTRCAGRPSGTSRPTASSVSASSNSAPA